MVAFFFLHSGAKVLVVHPPPLSSNLKSGNGGGRGLSGRVFSG